VEHASALNGQELTRTAWNCTIATWVESVSAGQRSSRAELAVIPEVVMVLRSTRGGMKMGWCARDDAGRPLVPGSPF
jgi:hypothetical protein